MQSATLILLIALLSVDVKGMVVNPKGRCQCKDDGVKFIPPKRIEKIEVYPPSSSCQHMEIIVILKESGGQKCLNPESRFAKNLIKNAQKE
ncbi:hypothetical protein JZ751_012414 [Albula glossodonta]|uniref:Chemokine interleukin-8-like domain-containing protein n=1 Tax=Albula glossodonta TaxID=121402 RepID=A0A8T2PSG7_9TELE|nr:hypothetical protein JZ751_012414 [Albula glossodonta]